MSRIFHNILQIIAQVASLKGYNLGFNLNLQLKSTLLGYLLNDYS